MYSHLFKGEVCNFQPDLKGKMELCYEVEISYEFAQCKSNKNLRLLEKKEA